MGWSQKISRGGVVPAYRIQPVITTPSLPQADVGVAYLFQLSAASGTSPYTFAISAGALPAGLSLASSGLITGTPTTVGTSSVSFVATDSVSTPSPPANFSLIVNPAVTATTTSLPTGTTGVAYSATLAATGGLSPYTWAITAGTLQAGLSLNSATGAITGTPAATGTNSITFAATDTIGSTGSKVLSLTVNTGVVTVTTTSPLPAATVGQTYSVTLAASGGVPPYTWAVTGLGDGLSLNSSTGVIAGTPGSATTLNLVATATDSIGTASAGVALSLTVNASTGPVPTLFFGPNGIDTNPGTKAAPWSLSGFNNASLRTQYGGQTVGLIAGRYQYTNTGTGQVSIYSQATAMPGGPPVLFQVEGNTTVVSCDANGNYLARGAVIDCTDPVTGNPVVSGDGGGGIIGQSLNLSGGGPNPNTIGGVTFDGITITGFGYSGILFRNLTAAMPNVTVKNCHVYGNGGQVTSNHNPGAIHITGVGLGANGFIATNNLIHTLSSQYTGTAFTENNAGIITIGCSGTTTLYNNTIYDVGLAFWNKDSTTNAGRVAYNYFGYGVFGVPTGSVDGGCVRQLMTGPNLTLTFDHNILLSDARSVGEAASTWNKGSVVVTNCTFFTPAGIGNNAGVSVVCAVDTTTPGNFTFQSNIVYSPNGYSPSSPAGFFVNQNNNGLTGITASSCNFNFYGNNANGMRFQNGPSSSNLTLAQWQGLGFDLNSTPGSNPFSGTPSETLISSFAVTGPATTAGVGGGICGAVDGTVSPIGLGVGCNFIAFTTAGLPAATVGAAYSATLGAAGGSGSYTYSLQSPITPNWLDWLTLSSAGVLSGTPLNDETETIVVLVTDTVLNLTAQTTLTLVVNPQ